jgi:hypothetical protein
MVEMSQTFVVLSDAGPHRDRTKGTREQPLWDEHARFIDGATESPSALARVNDPSAPVPCRFSADQTE